MLPQMNAQCAIDEPAPARAALVRIGDVVEKLSLLGATLPIRQRSCGLAAELRAVLLTIVRS